MNLSFQDIFSLYSWPPRNFYRPHPKDGEGNVFSLSTTGGDTPVPGSFQVLEGGGGPSPDWEVAQF